MKKYCLAVAVLVSAYAYAGGTVGGSPGLLQHGTLSLESIELSDLPKIYVGADQFRRTQARLSVADAGSVPLDIDGREIQVMSLRGGLVESKLSGEVLPRDLMLTGTVASP